MPVMKLLSSDARNKTALATSSGSPSRPTGRSKSDVLNPASLQPGVLVGPGLTALTRILRAFRSRVQLRANDRTAALLALYTLNASAPLIEVVEAVRMIEPPS